MLYNLPQGDIPSHSMGMIYLPIHNWWISMVNVGNYTVRPMECLGVFRNLPPESSTDPLTDWKICIARIQATDQCTALCWNEASRNVGRGRKWIFQHRSLTRWWFWIVIIFTSTWEIIQFDEHIFRMGWNHQLAEGSKSSEIRRF